MTTYLEGRMTFDTVTLKTFLARLGPQDHLIIGGNGAGVAYLGIKYADGHEELFTPEKVEIIRQIERAE